MAVNGATPILIFLSQHLYWFCMYQHLWVHFDFLDRMVRSSLILQTVSGQLEAPAQLHRRLRPGRVHWSSYFRWAGPWKRPPSASSEAQFLWLWSEVLLPAATLSLPDSRYWCRLFCCFCCFAPAFFFAKFAAAFLKLCLDINKTNPIHVVWKGLRWNLSSNFFEGCY